MHIPLNPDQVLIQEFIGFSLSHLQSRIHIKFKIFCLSTKEKSTLKYQINEQDGISTQGGANHEK